MQKGDTVTLHQVTGEIVRISWWSDGTKHVRLKDNGGKLTDHIIAPEGVLSGRML